MENNKKNINSFQKKLFMSAKLINSVIIILLFFGMFVYYIFFPRTTESNYDKDLKKFPEYTREQLISGEYFKGISDYLSDTIHGRDKFKEYASQIEALYGIVDEEQFFGNPNPPEGNENSSYTNTSVQDESDNSEVSENDSSDTLSTDNSSDTVSVEPEPMDEQLCEGIVILGTRAMELYYGNTDNVKKYAEYLNAYKAQLGDGVRVYSMVIPKACAYYIHDSKKFSDVWEHTVNDLETIKENLNGVENVDVYNALLPHTAEDIYFRTDHHWTGLGAYYGAQEFAKTAGVPFSDLSTYKKEVREGFVGTMYRYTNNSATLLNNPDDFIYYVPSGTYTASFYDWRFNFIKNHDMFFYISEEKKSNLFLTYLNGDAYAAKIESDVCDNGRKLIIFKDSYGNPLAPYLLESFEEIYVVDIRKFELNGIEFIQENGITDVLFAMSAYSAASSGVNRDIERIRVIQ
ncbi:MAG: DHHW family protein [Eubacteriales bacterium]|nr:DHHW family protein [Eubacteriales bacterium]